MGKVIDFHGETLADIPVENVIGNLPPLSCAIVMGWTEDDQLYVSSSTGDKREVLWLIESLKTVLLE